MARLIVEKAPVGKWEKAFVELLLLRKQDFDTVLKATIMKEWSQIRNYLLELPYFDGWRDSDIQDICMQSKISKYYEGGTILGALPPKISTIEVATFEGLFNVARMNGLNVASNKHTGDGFGVPNMSYFIAEGKAIILQHLIIVHETEEIPGSKWGANVKCLPLGTKIVPDVGQVVYMKIAEMDKGSCFSLGENMEDRRVVALSKVKIILIPLYSLTSRNQGYQWTRIRDFLNRRLPQQKEVFLAMLNGRDWMAYRKEVQDSQPGRPGNRTTIHDVPLSCRVFNNIPAKRYPAYVLGRLDHPKKWQWILKQREKERQQELIAKAKLEFRFEEEFMKTFGAEKSKKKKKGAQTAPPEEDELGGIGTTE